MDPLLITGVLGVATLIVLVLALLKIMALSKLVGKLADKIPGTAMSAKELADELGGSIDQAFSKYVPKPEQLASALSSAVEAAGKSQLEGAEKINKALAETAEAMTSGLGAGTEKLQSAFSGHAQEVQNALQGIGGVWRDEISGALSEHAQQLTAANNSLAAELQKIAVLEKDIVKLLHLEETVEGAMKEIAASTEFKATLEGLRTHLAESDQLLREAAKPRTIRLVESDGEIAEA